jgi:hypothetical protein
MLSNVVAPRKIIRSACFFRNFIISNIIIVNTSKMKKKYARLKGSLGFSNATAPAASNGPATKKANRSTKTNKPAISKIGRMSTAFLSRSSFQKNNNNLFINIPILIYLKSPDISCKKPFQTPKNIQRLTQPFLSSQFPVRSLSHSK